MEPINHLHNVVSFVAVVFDVLLVGPSGQGLHHLCVPVCAVPFWKGLIKLVISDNISVLQNYHPQHVDVFLTGMLKMKLACVGGEI